MRGDAMRYDDAMRRREPEQAYGDEFPNGRAGIARE